MATSWTRHTRHKLHSFESRLIITTLLVITVGTDGLHWIPSDKWIPMKSIFPVMTSGYLASVGRCFAHSIGKQRFPPESIGVYWTLMERGERKIWQSIDMLQFVNWRFTNTATKSKALDFSTLRFRDLIHIVQWFPPSEIHTRQYYHISVIRKDLDI